MWNGSAVGSNPSSVHGFNSNFIFCVNIRGLVQLLNNYPTIFVVAVESWLATARQSKFSTRFVIVININIVVIIVVVVVVVVRTIFTEFHCQWCAASASVITLHDWITDRAGTDRWISNWTWWDAISKLRFGAELTADWSASVSQQPLLLLSSTFSDLGLIRLQLQLAVAHLPQWAIWRTMFMKLTSWLIIGLLQAKVIGLVQFFFSLASPNSLPPPKIVAVINVGQVDIHFHRLDDRWMIDSVSTSLNLFWMNSN